MALLNAINRGAVLKLETLLGYGSYGQVFVATDQDTGGKVAVKKSRVSLRVQRTLLKHEARILQLLHGHPGIPKVYGYGRFKHFEYLSMELLGKCMGDMDVPPHGLDLKTVLPIADQILSALEHIHACGIVHRDIKPDNILMSLDGVSRLLLIDYGIARPYRSGAPSRHDPVEEHKHVVGTLNWASLNAHYGVDLSRRDDLESVAYVLLFLLRGGLPWKKSPTESSTLLQKMAQVREKKRAWTGSRLGQGLPVEFGQLLDYARGLGFNDSPDYSCFRALFKDLDRSHFGDATHMAAPRKSVLPENQPKPNETPSAPCIVELGQLVYVRVCARTTIEGYTSRAEDSSYWNDPSLSDGKWQTTAKPAIVVQVAPDWSGTRYIIKVIPLMNGRPSAKEAKNVVLLSIRKPSEALDAVAPDPTWPLDDTYCYAFPRANAFVCHPDQTEPVPAYWKISTDQSQSLLAKFDEPPPQVFEAENSADPDVRADAIMRKQFDYKVYAKLSPLQPSTLTQTVDGTVVDWEWKRGWFDELVKIHKRRSADEGWKWTSTSRQDSEEREEEELSNSYFELDIEEWDNRQQERDHSLTLRPEESALLDAQIQPILRIE